MCAFFTIYCVASILISIKTNTILQTSNNSLGIANPYPTIISDENFKKSCYRNTEFFLIEKKTSSSILEKTFKTPIFTLHWFFGSKSFYIYSYKLIENNELVNASISVPVTVTSRFHNGNWTIKKFLNQLNHYYIIITKGLELTTSYFHIRNNVQVRCCQTTMSIR